MQLAQASQEQHRRFYELFGTEPSAGAPWRDLSAHIRTIEQGVDATHNGVIASSFSTAVLPRYTAATRNDSAPFTRAATTVDTFADITDASARINIDGANTVAAYARSEAAAVSTVPDPDSPEGLARILGIISDHQTQATTTVTQSAAAESELGQRAAAAGGGTDDDDDDSHRQPGGEERDDDPTIQMVDNETDPSGSDANKHDWRDLLMPPNSSNDAAPDSPTGPGATTDAAKNPLDEMLLPDKNTDPKQPENLNEALDEIAGQPVPDEPTLTEQLLTPPPGIGNPGDPRYTKSPLESPIVGADPSVIGQQQARVTAAEQNLAAAQAAADTAARQDYMDGAGPGPRTGEAAPLAQDVFDARTELTEQRHLLVELNEAASEAGLPTAAVHDLPANADVQAFPAEPPVLDRATEALTEGTKDAAKTVWDATMPDVANMYDVATDYDNATPEQKRQAAIDAASMAPIPGGKLFGEAIEHGLDALGVAGRHTDDIPTGAVDDVANAGSGAAHSMPDAPSVPHADTDLDLPRADTPQLPHITEGGTSYDARLGQTPINNGQWQGERGESMWVSDNPDVNRYLEQAGVDGIEYRNGYPDFGPVTKGEVEIPNMTTSRDANFRASDNALAGEWGVTRKEVEIWRKTNGYTWHEQPDLRTMQLVPSVVNNRLGHVGGIGEINAGRVIPEIGEGP